MADDNKIEEVLGTRKTSKELWLFLIFIDLIALAVFGYFIYKHFTSNNSFFILQEKEVALEEVVIPEETFPAETKEIKTNEVAEIAPVIEESKQPTTQNVEPKIEEKAKEEPKVVETPKVKKQSYVITGTGKWRKVTFKYFDNAKSVSIVSGFTMSKPVKMKKISGVWQTTLTIAPNTYKYMFIVDGKEMPDPYNENSANGKSTIVIK